MKKTILTILICVFSFTFSYGQEQIVGQWNFDDATDLTIATVGPSLELFGNPTAVAGPKEGNGAVLLSLDDYLKVATNITPSGVGANVNTYTLNIDFKIDQLDGYASLLQTDLTNTRDGSLFLTSNKTIGNGDIGYSYPVITDGEWYRLVLVAEEFSADNVSFDIYLNGTLAYKGNQTNVDGRLSLADSMFICLDNDGEEKPIDVSQITLYNYALSSEEVAELGNALGEGKPLAPLPEGREFITNPNFDNDLNDWTLMVIDADATLNIDTTSQLEGKKSAHIKVNTLSSGTQVSNHIQLQQNIVAPNGINAGKKYYVQYKVKSNKVIDNFYTKIYTAHDTQYALEPENGYRAISLQANRAITIKDTLEFNITDDVVMLCFDLGVISEENVDVWIDAVHLIELYDDIEENLPKGIELLNNNYFTTGLENWNLYNSESTNSTLNLDTNGVLQYANSANIHLNKVYADGKDKIKFRQNGINGEIKKDRKYHIQFMAKSSKAISGISTVIKTLTGEVYQKEISLPENEVVTIVDTFYSTSSGIILEWALNLGTASVEDVDLWFDAIHLIELPIEYTSLFPPESTWEVTIPETLPRPGYLKTIHDSKYGVDITRISDATIFNVEKNSYKLWNHYPKDQAWNADMSLITLNNGYFLLNGDDYSVYKTFSNGLYESRWSNIDPDIKYFCEGNKLKKTNIETEEITTIRQFPGYNLTIGPWEGNISADDKYVVVTHESGGSAVKASLYDIELDSVISEMEFSGNGADWVTITPSGEYIVASNNVTDRIEVYDLQFNFLRNVGSSTQHGDFGVDSEGNEVWVQVIPVSMHRLSDGKSTRLLIENTGGHISGRGFNNPGWALVDFGIYTGGSGSIGYTGLTELAEIKLDGSGIVRHFGHARSSFGSHMGTVSPDGKKIIFNSDWNIFDSGDIKDETYAYIVEYREITDVEDSDGNSTEKMGFELSQNYPNPFNPTTTINFRLRIEGMTKLVVYNILGQQVKVLLNENMRAGLYSVPVNGSNLTSGVYFYKLESNNQMQVKKMLLIK